MFLPKQTDLEHY